MKKFISGDDRQQLAMFPERLDDSISDDNPVRFIDLFIEELDLLKLGFDKVEPAITGRPSYHPSTLLKIYIYGYLNRIQSSRRLERETQRNLELIWLTSRLSPDFKTIADFRKDNGAAIKKVCSKFVVLCKHMGMFTESVIAIDGSKFKAVNSRDNNYTERKLKARIKQTEARVARYLDELDRADQQGDSVPEAHVDHLKTRLKEAKALLSRLDTIDDQIKEGPDSQISMTDPDARSMATSGKGTAIVGYNVQSAVDDKHHLIVAHEVRPPTLKTLRFMQIGATTVAKKYSIVNSMTLYQWSLRPIHQPVRLPDDLANRISGISLNQTNMNALQER